MDFGEEQYDSLGLGYYRGVTELESICIKVVINYPHKEISYE